MAMDHVELVSAARHRLELHEQRREVILHTRDRGAARAARSAQSRFGGAVAGSEQRDVVPQLHQGVSQVSDHAFRAAIEFRRHGFGERCDLRYPHVDPHRLIQSIVGRIVSAPVALVGLQFGTEGCKRNTYVANAPRCRRDLRLITSRADRLLIWEQCMNTSSMFDPAMSSHSVDEAPAPQFAIAVSATLQQRRTRTLKYGDTFAVFDHRGDIGGEPGNPEGMYHRDTRMLSQLQLLLEEGRPLLLSSTTQDDNAVFTADLSNPDLLEDGKIALRRENIHLNRMKFIWNGACYERLVVRNFSDRPLDLASDLPLRVGLRGPFRGTRRAPQRSRRISRRAARAITQSCCATGASMRSSGTTEIAFHPAPKTLTTARAAFEIALQAPRDAQDIHAHRLHQRGAGRMERPYVLPANARRSACPEGIERTRRKR